MRSLWAALLAAGVVGVAGCGGADDNEPKPLPVSGVVTLDGTPFGGAMVTFTPTGDTRGHGGNALAGDDGTFTEVIDRFQKKGLVPGPYKVTVTKRRLPNGQPESPDVPPIESMAREQTPTVYTNPDTTPLTVTVETAGQKLDLKLSGKKK